MWLQKVQWVGTILDGSGNPAWLEVVEAGDRGREAAFQRWYQTTGGTDCERNILVDYLERERIPEKDWPELFTTIGRKPSPFSQKVQKLTRKSRCKSVPDGPMNKKIPAAKSYPTKSCTPASTSYHTFRITHHIGRDVARTRLLA